MTKEWKKEKDIQSEKEGDSGWGGKGMSFEDKQ